MKQHCKDVGRDYDEIAKTWSPEVFIRETEAELVAGGTRSFWGEPFESWREGNLVGTPEQVAEKIQAYIDLGCTGFVPWCSDYPDTESLRCSPRRSSRTSADRELAVISRGAGGETVRATLHESAQERS